MTVRYGWLLIGCLVAIPQLGWSKKPKLKDPAKISEQMLRKAEGGVHSGGGNVIVFYNIWGGIVFSRLADLYYSHPNFPTLDRLAFLGPDHLFELVVDFIDLKEPGLGKKIRAARSEFEFVYKDERLDRIYDDGIKSTGFFWRVSQLARQDFNTGLAQVDTKHLSLLSPVEEAFFRVHESLIRLRHDRGEPPETNFEVRLRLQAAYEDPELFTFALEQSQARGWADKESFHTWALASGLQHAVEVIGANDGRVLAWQRLKTDQAMELVRTGGHKELTAALKKIKMKPRGLFYPNALEWAKAVYADLPQCPKKMSDKQREYYRSSGFEKLERDFRYAEVRGNVAGFKLNIPLRDLAEALGLVYCPQPGDFTYSDNP